MLKSFPVGERNFEALVDTSETLLMRFVLNEHELEQDQVLSTLAPSAVLAHCQVNQESALAQTFGMNEQGGLAIFRQRIILYLEKGCHSIDQVSYLMQQIDRKSTRLNSSHSQQSRMPSSA